MDMRHCQGSHAPAHQSSRRRTSKFALSPRVPTFTSHTSIYVKVQLSARRESTCTECECDCQMQTLSCSTSDPGARGGILRFRTRLRDDRTRSLHCTVPSRAYQHSYCDLENLPLPCNIKTCHSLDANVAPSGLSEAHGHHLQTPPHTTSDVLLFRIKFPPAAARFSLRAEQPDRDGPSLYIRSADLPPGKTRKSTIVH